MQIVHLRSKLSLEWFLTDCGVLYTSTRMQSDYTKLQRVPSIRKPKIQVLKQYVNWPSLKLNQITSCPIS